MAGKSLNRVQLIGNLGKDPEVKYTPQGKTWENMGTDGTYPDYLVPIWD